MSLEDRNQVRDPVRVALVGCHGLVGDLIERAVRHRPEIDVVARLEAGIPATLGHASTGVDVVVWHDAEESEVSAWLGACRTTPLVLTTVDDGRGASLWELVPHRVDLGALSPTTLVDTLSSAPRCTATASEPTTKETSWPNN